MNKAPVVLSLISKAGGVGKTVTAINIGYEIFLRGFKVGIIDLDDNHSAEEFVGLDPEPNPDLTTVALLEDFQGDYNFRPILGTQRLMLYQGHNALEDANKRLVSQRNREFILKKMLTKHPPDLDVIIFDNQGGFNLLVENSIVASSHILIPVKIGAKILSVPELIEQIYQVIYDLDLDPAPEILGILPNLHNHKSVKHKQVLDSLLESIDGIGHHRYSAISFWQHLENSTLVAKALKQYRPSDPIAKVFSSIVDDLLESAKL